jgi:hypothetical protein
MKNSAEKRPGTGVQALSSPMKWHAPILYSILIGLRHKDQERLDAFEGDETTLPCRMKVHWCLTGFSFWLPPVEHDSNIHDEQGEEYAMPSSINIQIDRRQQRALKEITRIANKGNHSVFSLFEVSSLSGQIYSVKIRSLSEMRNSCSCQDYRTNLT